MKMIIGDITEFEQWVFSQTDLSMQIKAYAVSNPILADVGKFPILGPSIVEFIMIMGMWLYHTWLITHGNLTSQIDKKEK